MVSAGRGIGRAEAMLLARDTNHAREVFVAA